MRFPFALIAALYVYGAVAASDCPTPKPLTCEQLRAKEAQRCPPGEPCKPVIVDHVVQVPVACPPPPPLPVCPPAAEKVVEKTVTLTVPAPPKGHPLFGGGAIWHNGWGITALAGYQFKSGWQILAGPAYIKGHDSNGEAVGCFNPPGNGGIAWPGCCLVVPYHVAAPQPLAGQLLVVYAFK